MKLLKSLNFSYLVISMVVICSLFIVREALAERFFQTNNTWHKKIPANPTITANSANYVQSVVDRTWAWGISYGEWSVPVWYAAPSTPYTTVEGVGPMTLARGYNIDIPIPSEAVPGQNADMCALGGYVDSLMVVISADRRWAWDLFQARKCADGVWKAGKIRKWDLTGDGVLNADDNFGSIRVGRSPLLHGLITYNEVVNEGRINHALAFSMNREYQANYWGIYPAEYYYYSGLSTDPECPSCPKLGMRFQLDSSVSCNSLGLDNFGKMVCVAMQEYGMIFVENQGPGNSGLYAESLVNKPYSWQGIIMNNGNLAKIPLSKLRVVEPVYPIQSSSAPPTTPGEIRLPPR